jgi:O-antigen/teichoic acid export membrane protein
MVTVQVFSFITTVYIARALGPEAYGRLSFIFTIVTYFSLISFSGVPILGIRQIAKSKSQAEIKNNIMNITVLRALLAFVAFTALSLFIITMNKSIETKYIMFL